MSGAATVIVAHPTGNANSRALVRGLADAGMLDAFFTMLAVPGWLAELRALPAPLRAGLGRRAFGDIPWAKIRTAPSREAVRIAAQRLGLRRLVEQETGWACIEAVGRVLAERVARYIHEGSTAARTVYAYEDAALEAFRAARPRGLRCVYELPIADRRTMRRVLAEEREYAPAWVGTIDALRDTPAKLARKDEELELAEDVIVPCEFARRGLAREYDLGDKVRVVPYGAPEVSPTDPVGRRPGEPLRVVYVGHLSQRKGIAYLFEAMRRVGPMARLTLIGPRPARPCRALDRAIEAHTWVPPVPHGEALRRMREHHAMVFPSLCEGFGLVILEAMAQGVPVVTTTHTGGPDVIEDGVDGFIVPVRDPLAIAERLAWLHDDDRRRLAMAHAAKRKAAAFGWDRYRRDALGLLRAAAAGDEGGDGW